MDFLVATHLSSLSASQIISVPLRTLRQGAPLPAIPNESDPPAEHATSSSILHNPLVGTILLRVLHAGLIIELTSLLSEVPSIRIIFPTPVLSSPAVHIWNSSELHVLAVTDIGSLYRIRIPFESSRELWRNQAADIRNREYLLKNMQDAKHGLVHVQGTHCIIIGQPNGSLLRLEDDHTGEGNHDNWIETVFHQSSFLSSLTSLLPLNGSNPGSEIVSIATHPIPTDIGHVWTLSRDRTIRFWKAKIGCVSSKVLSPVKESTTTPGSSTNPNSSHPLLEASPRVALRVFTQPSQEEHLYVLAFTSSAPSPSSGGTFYLLTIVGDATQELGKFEASNNTAHCHLQDFVVIGNSLVVLWNCQGSSLLENTVINFHRQGFHATPWHTSRYALEPELTPAYVEEHFLPSGSMLDRFFEAIMKPGMFSALTLQLAIDQYTEACLSIPGPRPPQLGKTYATIGEHIAAVVGCTVNLNRDPQTGAYQHASYWIALRRDWEGFIARCREVERSARYPLALGIHEGEIVVVERERAGSVVPVDFPIRLRSHLILDQMLDGPQYELLPILWTLERKLGPEVMLNLEKRVMEIIRQEVAFAISDILRDQTSQFSLREQMDESFVHWTIGRLQNINDLDAAVRAVLDAIGGFDVEVKQEADESGLPPTPQSNWTQALTAAYIVKTVDARYGLALTLMTLLFFLSEEVSEWSPSLLAEIFAVFRGIAMLRYVTGRPAGALPDDQLAASNPALNAPAYNMHVLHTKAPIISTFSLTGRLLAQFGDTHGLPGAAHRFLDSTGLLQSISPANATRSEVVFCEKLRLLGFRRASQELLSWLPQTAGVSYVQARLWLDLGRVEDASHLFEKLAGSFGTSGYDHTLSMEDQEALVSVTSSTGPVESRFFFYNHVSELYKMSSWVYHEASFAERAISVAPPAADTSSLWNTVITALTALALYEDAYTLLMSSPYEKLNRECVSQLAYRMCEDNAADRLVKFNFCGLADEVEDALAFKSRNADPRIYPSYSRILYKWYVYRGDYRNAALAMLQRVRKFEDLSDSTSFMSIAEEQLDAYNLAINALSLVSEEDAWVLLPIPADHTYEKRKTLSRHIPANKILHEKLSSDIIRLADIRYDYALLIAQLDITRRDSTFLFTSEYLPAPSMIVLKLAQANRFTLAMATARSLNVDMTDLFRHLTKQCLRLSQNPDAVIQENTSDWLLTDKVLSWTGTPADRGWRYLRQSLLQHDSADNDCQYAKTVLETILGADNFSSPPPWLIQILQEHHHEYLIRVNLRLENVEAAVQQTLALIRKSEARSGCDAHHNTCTTWLPYTLIEQVMAAATEVSTPRLATLQAEISSRVKRMQIFSQPLKTLSVADS